MFEIFFYFSWERKVKKRTKEEAIEENPVLHPDIWLSLMFAGWLGTTCFPLNLALLSSSFFSLSYFYPSFPPPLSLSLSFVFSLFAFVVSLHIFR